MTANSGVSLSVPATSRERRDSTNNRIADGIIVLRNIDVNSVSRRATTLVARAPEGQKCMQWSNLFCPCKRSEIGEVPQGEGVEKDSKYAVSLSVPAMSRERRDSTKCRIAIGAMWLR